MSAGSPMTVMRMLLLRDGTTIGAFHKPLGKSVESFSLRGSSAKSIPFMVNCVILEPKGNCFTLIDATALSTSKLQRFTSASCPSVHVPMLREVLRFRNMYFHQNIYVHQHHLRKEQLQWRSTPLPTQIRWRCGGFKAASMKTENGMYLFQSMDGIANVTLDDTGSIFEATCFVPVAMHNDTTRFPVSLIKQRFYRDQIPDSWTYPASVLILAHQATITNEETFEIYVEKPYMTSNPLKNTAFTSRPVWSAVEVEETDRTTLLAVDVYNICQHLSTPATKLGIPIAAEWTREASFVILAPNEGRKAFIRAHIHNDASHLSYSQGFFKHYTRGNAPNDHCFTLDTVPPPLSTRAYNLDAICRNMDFLLQSVQSQTIIEPATPVSIPLESSNTVVEDQTTSLGRFRAFGDGRVRVVFTDRTILAVDANSIYGTLFLPNGVSVSIMIATPPEEYHPYVIAATSFQIWAQQTPKERMQTTKRQQENAKRIEDELTKTRECLMSSKTLLPLPTLRIAPNSTDIVQEALAKTQAHLQSVHLALERYHDKKE